MANQRINIPVSPEELDLVAQIKAKLKPTLGEVTTAGAVRWALRVAAKASE